MVGSDPFSLLLSVLQFTLLILAILFSSQTIHNRLLNGQKTVLSEQRKQQLIESAKIFKDTQTQRIRLLGCCGTGKSVLANQLADIKQTKVIPIDDISWLPGWKRADPNAIAQELFDETHENDRPSSWVLDGNYKTSSKERILSDKLNKQLWDETQMAILLDYPFESVMYRGSLRTMRNVITHRPLCNGNYETWSMLLCNPRNTVPYYIYELHGIMPERLESVKQACPDLPVLTLHSQTETDYFLDQIRQD